MGASPGSVGLWESPSNQRNEPLFNPRHYLSKPQKSIVFQANKLRSNKVPSPSLPVMQKSPEWKDRARVTWEFAVDEWGYSLAHILWEGLWSPVPRFCSGPAYIAVVVHLGSGYTVVSSVKVLLPFESCHEEVGPRPLPSAFQALLENIFFLLHVLLLLPGSSIGASPSCFWDMVSPRPCSVGNPRKSACVGRVNRDAHAAALAPVTMGALSKWPLAIICLHI